MRLGRSRLINLGVALAASGGWMFAMGSSTIAQPACASTMNRAGVVVHSSPADERSWCIAFSGETITGMELLRATSVPLITKSFGSMGEYVCKIGDVGTDASDCPARDGSYWAYYHLSADGTWAASSQGASVYKDRNGAVDGWSWQPIGKGTTPLPNTFAGVCPGDAPHASPSPSTSPSPSPGPSPSVTVRPSSGASAAGVQPQETATTPSHSAGSSPTSGPITRVVDASMNGTPQAPLIEAGSSPKQHARYEAASKARFNPVGYLAFGVAGFALVSTRMLVARRRRD
ncbi:MAG: hypothetical protein ABR507_11215 [Actinomycetota bacterium]|nr:hypothetical protein [Actinomycetota bacterium]